MIAFLIVLVVILIIVVANGIRVVTQYEQGVVFRLGRVRKAVPGPAWFSRYHPHHRSDAQGFDAYHGPVR